MNDTRMKREHKFEVLEHTADVGVVGLGRTMAEAFEAAAYGMFSIVANLEKYDPTIWVHVEASGDDYITLFERFLSSLVVIFDGDGLLPLDFEITEISSTSLACVVSCRKIGDDIEWLGPTIKAVTYHLMSVENVDGHWRAQAIFDV
ncbi:MAG: archease [Armatimonadota bacterium]|nr:archease [bacterium]